MPKIPRFYANPSIQAGDIGVRVDPGTLGSLSRTGLEGVALGELGKDIETVGQKLTAEHQRTQDELARKSKAMAENNYIVNGFAQFKLNTFKEFNKRKQEAGANVENFSNNFDKYFNEQASALVAGAPTPEAGLKLQSRLGSLRVSYMDDSLRHESSTMKMNRLTSSAQMINEMTNQAFLNPQAANVLLDEANTIADSLMVEGISPGQVQKIKNGARQDILAASLDGSIKDNPVQVLQALASGQYNELDNGKMVSLFNKAALRTKQQYQEIAAQEKEKHLQSLYLSGIPLDSSNKEHREAVDKQYQKFLEPFFKNGKLSVESGVFAKAITEFVSSRPSVLPGLLKSQIETSVQHGDPKVKEAYSRVLRELDDNEKTRPLLDGISSKALNEGLYINQMVSSGISPEEAARQARESVRPERSDLAQIRVEELKNFRSGDEGPLNKANILSAIDDRFDSIFSRSPKNQELAIKEYTRFFEDAYKETGDIDIAQRNAVRQLSRQFAVSNLNGKPELMKNAPTIRYPGREDEINSLYEQFLQSVDEREDEVHTLPSLGFEDKLREPVVTRPSVKGREIMIDGKMRKVQLQSDRHTASDGGYSVFFYDENDQDNLFPHFVKNPITGATARFIPQLGAPTMHQEAMAEIEHDREVRNQVNKEVLRKAQAFEAHIPQVVKENKMTPVQESNLMSAARSVIDEIKKDVKESYEEVKAIPGNVVSGISEDVSAGINKAKEFFKGWFD